MQVDRVIALFYSATGCTDRVVSQLAETVASKGNLPIQRLDITRPAMHEQDYSFTDKDLVIAGTPTYAGRVPNKLLPFWSTRLQGGGALTVPVVLFGNRNYDHALAEICAVLQRDGFHTLAAAAFVGRHAFTDTLGFGRPDYEDRRQIDAFAQAIIQKMERLDSPPPPICVPGDPNAPYYIPKGVDGQAVNFLKAKPQTNLARCTNCGVCARVCPMGAIDPKNVANVTGICIKCQACVRKCTKNAKYFDDPAFLSHVSMLEKNFIEPKKNEVFL